MFVVIQALCLNGRSETMAKSISDKNVDLYMCTAHFKPEYLELVSDKGNTFKLKALNEESIALPSQTVTSKQKILFLPPRQYVPLKGLSSSIQTAARTKG